MGTSIVQTCTKRILLQLILIFFYSIGIHCYALFIRIATLFSAKAKLFIQGRKNQKAIFNKSVPGGNQRVIWFHCASLGEFEMARPIIEDYRIKHSDHFIVLTFFSPSGYEIRKNYTQADAILYLPFDTRANAFRFVEHFHPDVAVFVKYEVWIHFFNTLKQSGSKIIMMNAVFRKDQRFFKWYGGIFRNALNHCETIFVQSASSKKILDEIGIQSVVSGDTRYDRCTQVADSVQPIPEINRWINGKFCIVVGSSWPEEEKIIAELQINDSIQWIIVPHDVSSGHILAIKNLFTSSFTMSGSDFPSDKNVLIVDSIGQLNKIYQYADLSIVGGGFSGKLHNILEPAAYGSPVLIGPKHSRFEESQELKSNGFVYSFSNGKELSALVERFQSDPQKLKAQKTALKMYFREKTGAVALISDWLEKHS